MTKTFSILDLVPTDVDLEELMEEDGSSRLSVALWVCVKAFRLSVVFLSFNPAG